MHRILVKCNHKPLIGKIKVNGSKNAALPIIAATLLTESSVILYNVPDLVDVHLMSELLKSLGAKVKFIHNEDYKANHVMEIDCSDINNYAVPFDAASELRTSSLMLGPMLGRFGKISTVFPGGCKIGKRPVDMHIKALEEMGAKIDVDGCVITATLTGKLRGKEIIFEKVSVGATQNVIMAATLAEGVTTVRNAAMEPEVIDLVEFLKSMGSKIDVCNSVITVEGVEKLNGCIHKIMPDRIEAGTYALAAVITNGKLKLEGVHLTDIRCTANILVKIGAKIEVQDDGIVISRKSGSVKSVNVATNPYPRFPTDMQAQLMSVMAVADGISVIEENIFENRFTHAAELQKLGANISIEGNKATICGMNSLSGGNLYANDLRSAAALILAALVAEGETVINNSQYLLRGYEAMDEKLNSCGAHLEGLN